MIKNYILILFYIMVLLYTACTKKVIDNSENNENANINNFETNKIVDDNTIIDNLTYKDSDKNHDAYWEICSNWDDFIKNNDDDTIIDKINEIKNQNENKLIEISNSIFNSIIADDRYDIFIYLFNNNIFSPEDCLNTNLHYILIYNRTKFLQKLNEYTLNLNMQLSIAGQIEYPIFMSIDNKNYEMIDILINNHDFDKYVRIADLSYYPFEYAIINNISNDLIEQMYPEDLKIINEKVIAEAKYYAYHRIDHALSLNSNLSDSIIKEGKEFIILYEYSENPSFKRVLFYSYNNELDSGWINYK